MIQVIAALEDHLRKVDVVDALLLVGEFSASPYLFERIWVSDRVLFVYLLHTLSYDETRIRFVTASCIEFRVRGTLTMDTILCRMYSTHAATGKGDQTRARSCGDAA